MLWSMSRMSICCRRHTLSKHMDGAMTGSYVHVWFVFCCFDLKLNPLRLIHHPRLSQTSPQLQVSMANRRSCKSEFRRGPFASTACTKKDKKQLFLTRNGRHITQSHTLERINLFLDFTIRRLPHTSCFLAPSPMDRAHFSRRNFHCPVLLEFTQNKIQWSVARFANSQNSMHEKR